MNVPILRELELMDQVMHDHEDDMPLDALDHADCVGLMNEDIGVGEGIHCIYARAGFDATTSVDAAFNHTCQLEAGFLLLDGDYE